MSSRRSSGENCAKFSEAEHHAKVRADKQAAPVELVGRQTDARSLPSAEREREDALHILAKTKSGRACGPDAMSSELIAAGGQGCRRALGALCAKVSREGAPILWKGGDMAAVPRKTRATRAEQFERSVVFQLPRKDVCQCATSSSGTLAPHVSWHVANGSGSRRRNGIRDHDAELVQLLG